MSDNKQYYYNLKSAEFDQLRKTYASNGTVSWTTFSANPNIHQKKVIELQQSDFDHGTLRIQNPGCFILTENIAFNPNRPTTWLDASNAVTNDFSQAKAIDPNRSLDWFPKSSAPNNAQYFEPEVAFAYGLGFFAAITVECRDVIIDLNNYTLEQHKEHQLQQRFFATIELADQPFIPFQGPSNFGSVLRSARNTCICNGILGLSSHHGIHGNDGDNIMIRDVQFHSQEVAGVSINGFRNIFFKDVTTVGNNHNIPVLGTYSAGRFIKNFVALTVLRGHQTPGLLAAMATLNTQMDTCFNAHIFSSGTIPSLFANASKLIDGNGYGILINPKGVAVGPFIENRQTSRANETTNIYMNNCQINNVDGKINEIVAISGPNGNGVQVDTAGAALQLFNGASNKVGDKYYYAGTALTNVQIELARIKNTQSAANYLGTLNIQPAIVQWKDNSALYFKAVNGIFKMYNGSNAPHLIGGIPIEYIIEGNCDTMFHVNKGMIGLRIDGGNDICIINCGISNVSNDGNLGSTLPGAYVKSHKDTGDKLIGYQGAKTFGAVLSACNNVIIRNLNISGITSTHGSACGLSIRNGSTNMDAKNVLIQNVSSNANGTFSPTDVGLPNEVAISRGIHVGPDCFNIDIINFDCKNMKNSSGNPYDLTYDIQSKIQLKC